MDGITIQNREIKIISSVLIFRHVCSKVPEKRQLDGMIEELNQEESMKLSLKNVGWSCALESHKLSYSFHFCSIPNL